MARRYDTISFLSDLGLADVVREMVTESRTVEGLVGQAQQRLQQELARATELNERVQALESERDRPQTSASLLQPATSARVGPPSGIGSLWSCNCT